LWADYRELALSYGLRAAWSQPLLSKNQHVLGTFGMYYPEAQTPSETDLRLIEGAGHIAVIAIEGERSQEALRSAFAGKVPINSLLDAPVLLKKKSKHESDKKSLHPFLFTAESATRKVLGSTQVDDCL
jgi:hypothetical protein